MSEPIRIGLTGTGSLGTYLGRDFEAVDDAEIAAVTDVDDGNRAEAAETFGVSDEHRYEDHGSMLDSIDLDAVSIATPHALHYDQVVAALERGVHVLCEKPLCTDLDDARDLVELAESTDAVLMVGYQRHLSPVFATARARLGEVAGEPNYLSAEITQDWIAHQRDAWRGNAELSGGGQLYDTGSHLLDAVLWVTDLTPTAVDATMVFDDPNDRVDKQASLNVEFAEGAVASIGVSGDAPRTREHLHVWGDDGAVYVDGEDWDRRELTFIDDDGAVTEPNTDEWGRKSKPEALVECVRDGEDPPATARDALAVTAVTEAAYESARTGETVEIDL